MKLYKGITVFNAWLKNERVAVAVCQWISLALCMATSRSYAKSANYHFCDLIEMWYVPMFLSTLSTPLHVPTLLVNHQGMCDINRLLVCLWPYLRHPQWFNAMTVRYHCDHTVVIPSREHDFSCHILPLAMCSAFSSSFPPTSPDIYQFLRLAPFQSPEGPFRQFMKQIHARKEVICSGTQQVSSCQV